MKKKKKDCRQLVKKRDGNSSPNDDMSELKCGNGGEMISRKKVFLSFFFLVLLARSSVITSCASAWVMYMYTHNATMKEVVSLFNCPALALAQRRKKRLGMLLGGRAGRSKGEQTETCPSGNMTTTGARLLVIRRHSLLYTRLDYYIRHPAEWRLYIHAAGWALLLRVVLCVSAIMWETNPIV